jgi:hypothetical protein
MLCVRTPDAILVGGLADFSYRFGFVGSCFASLALTTR